MGIVEIFPKEITFNQGPAGQRALLKLMWTGSGRATLVLTSQGGIYQNLTFSVVIITALPYLPASPQSVMASTIYPLALNVSWLQQSLSSDAATGYLVQVSFTSNFSSLDFEAKVAIALPLISGSTYQNSSSGLRTFFITPSFSSKSCAYVRVFGYNDAGFGPPGNAVGDCVILVDEPPAVQNIALEALGEDWVRVQWTKAADYEINPEVLGHRVDITVNGSIFATRSAPPINTAAILPIPLNIPVQVAVRVIDSNLGLGPASKLEFQYAGFKEKFLIPLSFSVSPLSQQAPAGSSSFLVVKPDSQPSVDAWVRVYVSDSFVAAVTDHILFRAGIVAPQTVVVTHLRKGETNITFSPIGGLYRGLAVTVFVSTLPSTI
jgi:hypothetical protein